MGPGETRDLVFAGAGILWGVVTIFHGTQSWVREKSRAPFPAMIAIGAGLAISCLGYLVFRL